MVLDGLDLTLTDVDALPKALGNFYLGGTCPALPGQGQEFIGNRDQCIAAMREEVFVSGLGLGHWRQSDSG